MRRRAVAGLLEHHHVGLMDDASIPMPDLTRRPDPHRADCWLIYFGDVHVGTLARAVGTPNATEEWRWQCGFYPGWRPGEHRAGSAPSFNQACSDFEHAWRTFSARRTEADYQAWRDQRDWTEKKYTTRTRGEKVSTAR